MVKYVHIPIFLHSLTLHCLCDAGLESALHFSPTRLVSLCKQVTDRLCTPEPQPAEHWQKKYNRDKRKMNRKQERVSFIRNIHNRPPPPPKKKTYQLALSLSTKARSRWGSRWKNALNHYKNNGRNFQYTKFSVIDFVLTDRVSLSGTRPKSACDKFFSNRLSFSAVRNVITKATKNITFGFSFRIWFSSGSRKV